MRRVARAEEAPTPASGREKHAVAPGFRSLIRHAMQHGVCVHTLAQGPGDVPHPRSFFNFVGREVLPFGELAVQERGGDPRLVSHFQRYRCIRNHQFDGRTKNSVVEVFEVMPSRASTSTPLRFPDDGTDH